MIHRSQINACRRSLESDLLGMGMPGHWRWRYLLTSRIATFVGLLRLAESLRPSGGGPRSILYYPVRFLLERVAERCGFDIPLHVFAPGLSIAHRGTIVVNGSARVGRNCRIHQGVTIGAIRGLAPRIGDDVFIGPNAGIYGDVSIGDGAKIGPHALVLGDVPSGRTVVAASASILTRE